MRCVYQGRQVLSVVPDEPQGRVAAGLGDQGVFPVSFDASENDITRVEIMDYLNQTYGPVFVENLLKHLASSGDGKE